MLESAQPRVSKKGCHGDHVHPDHSKQILRLRRIRGQIDGIERMVNKRRYCIEILRQVKAASAALKAFELAVFKTHLKSCVSETLALQDQHAAELKIEEIIELLGGR